MEAPLSATDAARIARLEERMTIVLAVLDEIRDEQKEMSETIARASGGMRMLLMLGGLAGFLGALREIAGITATWLPNTAPGGH